MEIAIHLRYMLKKEPLNPGLIQLGAFYDNGELKLNEWMKRYLHFSRVYVGDEFCENRLPDITELVKIRRFCEEHHLGLTLLTPPLTDLGIEKCRPLFEYISENLPIAEVVANDMGVLLFLKKYFPRLSLSMGRLMNKGFKDPRLQVGDKTAFLSEEVHQLLNEGTFDQQNVINMALKLSVNRMERDLLPYAEQMEGRCRQISQSVYFPFGYVTTGRVCWISSFQKKGREKFLMNHDCSRFCEGLPLMFKNSDANFRLFQNGNTIFYLYPPSMLNQLLNAEPDSHLRLVYQGFALS